MGKICPFLNAECIEDKCQFWIADKSSPLYGCMFWGISKLLESIQNVAAYAYNLYIGPELREQLAEEIEAEENPPEEG